MSNSATSRGMKIRLYEDLYRQYTRLAFTRISDRPIAIAGLEKRLIRDLEVQGGFGVFDDGRSLLQRSLLWQRGQEVPSLAKIPSAQPLSVPTWSWMAYDGGIDFLDLPLGGVHWFPDAIRSPWATGSSNTWHTGDGEDSVQLKAEARHFSLGDVRLAAEDEVVIMYDDPGVKKEEGDLMCVVVGREKKKKSIEEMTHFVLFIMLSKEPLGTPEGKRVYERIGVGHMKGQFLDLKAPVKAIVIH